MQAQLKGNWGVDAETLGFSGAGSWAAGSIGSAGVSCRAESRGLMGLRSRKQNPRENVISEVESAKRALSDMEKVECDGGVLLRSELLRSVTQLNL